MYTKEIKETFKDIFKDVIRSEEDFEMIEEVIFETLGTSYKKMSEEIEVGIKNGYSLESQLKLFKRVIHR